MSGIVWLKIVFFSAVLEANEFLTISNLIHTIYADSCCCSVLMLFPHPVPFGKQVKRFRANIYFTMKFYLR